MSSASTSLLTPLLHGQDKLHNASNADTLSRSCIIDYFPKKRIPGWRTAAMWALRISTITVGVALYSFETNDVGITEAIKRLWHA
jgi:hypothetical protein